MNIIEHLEKKSRLKIKFNVPRKDGIPQIRKAQFEAIEAAISTDFLNIGSPTGSGKSLTLRGISYYHVDNQKIVVIVVPSYDIGDSILIDLAHETHSINPKFHAPQRSVQIDRSTKIIITTYASFWRRIDTYIAMYGINNIVVIYDEAHHVNVLAPRNFEAAKSFKNVYCVTASPWSPFCLDLTKNRYIYKLKDAIKDGVVAQPNLIDYIPSESDNNPEFQPEIWYYDSIEEAFLSFGKSFTHKANGISINHHAGPNLHAGIRAGLTCSINEISTLNLVREFNRGKITRAVVIDKLKEGFDANLRINGKKIPVRRVVIKTHEKSPISLIQRAGRAFRIGGGTVHAYSTQLEILRYAFDLANGMAIVCDICQKEHLTIHHNAVVNQIGE